jgi:hypothetical protein
VQLSRRSCLISMQLDAYVSQRPLSAAQGSGGPGRSPGRPLSRLSRSPRRSPTGGDPAIVAVADRCEAHQPLADSTVAPSRAVRPRRVGRPRDEIGSQAELRGSLTRVPDRRRLRRQLGGARGLLEGFAASSRVLQAQPGGWLSVSGKGWGADAQGVVDLLAVRIRILSSADLCDEGLARWIESAEAADGDPGARGRSADALEPSAGGKGQRDRAFGYQQVGSGNCACWPAAVCGGAAGRVCASSAQDSRRDERQRGDGLALVVVGRTSAEIRRQVPAAGGPPRGGRDR